MDLKIKIKHDRDTKNITFNKSVDGYEIFCSAIKNDSFYNNYRLNIDVKDDRKNLEVVSFVTKQ